MRWKQNDYIIKFMIYNHQLVSLKMTIKFLNNFKTICVKRRTFIIIFQFIIFISILWQLSKHDRRIEKTTSMIHYINLYEICSKLFHENETLTSKNSMLMDLILFFWFCFFFFFMWSQIVWLICIEMMKWRRDATLSLSAEKIFYFEVWF